MKQFFKKSLLEFVALSTTIHSSPIAYIHLDTVLLILIVLYLCFSSVSACLMQRLSFSLSEIKTYWKTVGLFSVSMSFWIMHTFCLFTKHIQVLYKCQECVCGGYECRLAVTDMVGWCARNRLRENVSSERQQSRLGTHTRQVCVAYVVTWCL